MRAKRICPKPGCPNLISGNARLCTEHLREMRLRVDTGRPSPTARGYDAQWRKIRARHLRANPYCVECGRRATEVDHHIPLADGGTHDSANLRSKCKTCHSRKTASVDGGFGNVRKVER